MIAHSNLIQDNVEEDQLSAIIRETKSEIANRKLAKAYKNYATKILLKQRGGETTTELYNGLAEDVRMGFEVVLQYLFKNSSNEL